MPEIPAYHGFSSGAKATTGIEPVDQAARGRKLFSLLIQGFCWRIPGSNPGGGMPNLAGLDGFPAAFGVHAGSVSLGGRA